MWYLFIMAIDIWSLLSANETHRKAQKHRIRLHSCDITITQLWHRGHASLGLKRTSSALDMARLQHGFGLISFTLAGEKVPNWAGSVPAHFMKVSWASMAQLGSAWCWHGYKWQCKYSISKIFQRNVRKSGMSLVIWSWYDLNLYHGNILSGTSNRKPSTSTLSSSAKKTSGEISTHCLLHSLRVKECIVGTLELLCVYTCAVRISCVLVCVN